jgi:hypothetical protein
MPEIVADPPEPSCYLLFSGPGIEESQSVGPDPSSRRARDMHGRFAHGKLRQPAGPSARHPQSEATRAQSRRPTAERGGASAPDRPPLGSTNPAKHLGIDLSSLPTVEDVRQMLSAVLAAAASGGISPAEAASIARRACARLRAIRRSHT